MFQTGMNIYKKALSGLCCDLTLCWLTNPQQDGTSHSPDPADVAQVINLRWWCSPLGAEALAGCTGTSGQVKVEPEPAGLAVLVSLSLPLLGSNQPWFCCSPSEEPFRNTTGDLGWELVAQALSAALDNPCPQFVQNSLLSEQSVPGHRQEPCVH